MVPCMVQERYSVLRDGCRRCSAIRFAYPERHKAPQQRGLVIWRDPDSNWGHHDFQLSMVWMPDRRFHADVVSDLRHRHGSLHGRWTGHGWFSGAC